MPERPAITGVPRRGGGGGTKGREIWWKTAPTPMCVEAKKYRVGGSSSGEGDSGSGRSTVLLLDVNGDEPQERKLDYSNNKRNKNDFSVKDTLETKIRLLRFNF